MSIIRQKPWTLWLNNSFFLFHSHIFSLGERIGAVHAFVNDAKIANIISSQMKAVIRGLYSNPPLHGALIVKTILSDPILLAEW